MEKLLYYHSITFKLEILKNKVLHYLLAISMSLNIKL
nr:MAG TPA: hypothetical protein [Bacteriophage sp.]